MAQQQTQKSADELAVRLEGVRLSFPALDKKKSNGPGSDKESFQATFLFPPGYDFTKLKAAMKAAVLKKWNKLDVKGLRNPLRDASEKEYAGYDKGWMFLATKSDVQVPVVGPDKLPIDLARVYAGCYVNAHVSAWCYDNKWGKGISFNLKAIQFVKEGERLDGRGKPSDPDAVFDALELPPDDGGASTGGGDDTWSPF